MAQTIDNINWYPGHMKKTRELIRENLKMVDAVVEVTDARIPVSSRNPLIDEILGNKPRIIALNKSDLADAGSCKGWTDWFAKQGFEAVSMNANSGSGIRDLLRILEKMERENEAALSSDDRRGAECREVLSHQPDDRTKIGEDRR